jgi:hypothetical protein
MHHRFLPGAGRLAVLLTLLLGVLTLGAQQSAWATPSQSPAAQTVPTRTPNSAPGPRINLNAIRCDDGNVRIEFIVVQLPDGVTDYGAISYVVNGQTRTAAFSGLNGVNARYADVIPPAQQASNGVYSISSATLTLTLSGGTATATLTNPGARTAECRQPPSQGLSEQQCSVGPIREAVAPGTVAQLLACQWSLAISGDDLGIRGVIELTQVSPAVSNSANAGDTFFGQHVDLTLFDDQGRPITQPSFAKPVELCAIYTADDLVRVGSPSRFVIQVFDPATSRWVALRTTPDPTNNRVCAQLPHFSRYALVARVQQPPPSSAQPPANIPTRVPSAGVQVAQPGNLPKTGGLANITVPAWLWLVIGLTVGSGLALVLRRRLNA